MATNRFAATFAVGVFLFGVPVAAALRLSGGALPFRSIDLVLAIGIVGWLQFTKAMFDRDDPVDSTRVHRTSLRWQAHALVEASVFGAAASVAATPTAMVPSRLLDPSHDISGQLPPPVLTSVVTACLLYTSPSPRDKRQSRMPSSA